MIAVSDAWKDRQQRFLLPESFVEITCAITEPGVQESATASGTTEEIFSDVAGILGTADTSTQAKYATLERNLWSLDGTRTLLKDSEPYNNVGYVSSIESTASVTLHITEVHTTPIPGVTITWSSEYEEYPHTFTVTARMGDTVVAETTVTENQDRVCHVLLSLANYDSVTVTVHDWCFPNRRPRLDEFFLGHWLRLGKEDLLSYSHDQFGCLSSGELPKNEIRFSLDNVDDRWNPTNPTGLEQFLSERQRITVRYGLDIDGTTEWIKGGTFFMSEWSTPSNGIEASFVARDALEFMIGTTYTGRTSGTLLEIVNDAIKQAELPAGITVKIDNSLANYSADFAEENNIAEYSIAEVIQLCANAAKCVFYQDRNGTLHIEPHKIVDSGYVIGKALAYSYPEIELSKQLRKVVVNYAEGSSYTLPVATNGEDQTMENYLISTDEQAAEVAAWVRDSLLDRKNVKGEYRADPRLDLFDVVMVETKYGSFPVVISNIVYTFTGCFRGSYSGRVKG